MKYRDLVQFDPIQEVVQLIRADDQEIAQHLVKTYVISDRMAEVLIHRIFPALQLGPVDKGGVLIVGNYGTGKSHLMSVISALAEDPEMLGSLSHSQVASAAQAFAGRFQVIRQEIGATDLSLRDIVLHYLQEGLRRMGVEVAFPPMGTAPNNKDLLAQAMAAFHKRYPAQGLLFVLDELLDYLQSRNQQQLFSDLAFLRELGESCANLNLRFIAGVQEALFDNPRFSFAGDAIRRVRDRFIQVRIVREDVAYVVAHRLLAKDEEQKRLIRRHLERFTHRYGDMAQRLAEFVDLFPVHPAYLEVLEHMTLVEKRLALRAISNAMARRLDDDLPDDHPGLIAFDDYWYELMESPDQRTDEAVRETWDKAQVLEERATNALKGTPYQEPARRIIHALAIYRLATGDVHAPIGLTPEDLRDKLCLHIPNLPEDDADFLLTSIRSTLDQILRAVSGQFISHNEDNDQYYLDLRKDVDYDAKIQAYIETLSPDDLDKACFAALKEQLELTDQAYVPTFPIWLRELPWEEHGVTRDGYFFLGHPSTRSTAQPERDFYVYFLEVYKPLDQALGDAPDEVYFKLTGLDEDFDRALRRYAAARALADRSTGAHKQVYAEKARQALRQLGDWLRDNALQAFTVRFRSEERAMAEWLAPLQLTLRETNFRDRVFRLAGALLEVWFRELYPHYPKFRQIRLTLESLPSAADAALRVLAGTGPRTSTALAVLEALGLAHRINGDVRFTVEQSPYAQVVLRRLETQQVVNRHELLTGPVERPHMVEAGLEPPLLAVVLAALLRQGLAEVRHGGKTLGADDLGDIARMGSQAFVKGLQTVHRPRQLPQKALEALFTEAGLAVGLVRAMDRLDEAVQVLLRWALEEQERIQSATDLLVHQGLLYEGHPALTPEERAALERKLEDYRKFVDRLADIRRPGQLRRFRWGEGEVRAFFNTRRQMMALLKLRRQLDTLNPLLAYLRQAFDALPEDHPWRDDYLNTLAAHRDLLAAPQERRRPLETIRHDLEALRSDYIGLYLDLHARHRLDYRGGEERGRLARDPRWQQLRMLEKVNILPNGAVAGLLGKMEHLVACRALTARDLQDTPFCPDCGLKPREVRDKRPAQERLEGLAEGLDTLARTWVEVLQEELRKPKVQKNIPVVGEPWSSQLQALAKQGALPTPLTEEFVEAINDVLGGLEKVILDGNEVLTALSRGGPATPAALLQRLQALVEAKIQGHDPDKVRLEIDW